MFEKGRMSVIVPVERLAYFGKKQIKKDRLIDKKKNIGYNSRQIKHTKILGIKRR